jgi:predicted transcriptional regulator
MGIKKTRLGRLSKADSAFIKGNVDKMTVQQIAKKLGRAETSIYDWIDKNVGFSKAEKQEVEVDNELKSRPYYRELANQFSPDELKMFEFHFKKMWTQFKDDVFHTEEIQIMDTIKLEILMNRILKNQQDTLRRIYELENDIDRERKLGDDADQDLILNWERQKSGLIAAQETTSKDYKEFQARKASMLKELKGTRQQRIQEIESSKKTFATLIQKLTVDPNYRQAVGLEMEKRRIAMETERARLSKVLQYEDGRYDRPLLNSDSVILPD